MVKDDFNNVISADANNALTRRIVEIQADDDYSQEITFIELDTAILREVQP